MRDKSCWNRVKLKVGRRHLCFFCRRVYSAVSHVWRHLSASTALRCSLDGSQKFRLRAFVLDKILEMPHCMVPNCTNGWRKTKGTSITYHRLPSGELKLVWLQKIRRENPRNEKHSFVCSEHFTPDCFQDALVQQTLKPRRILKSDAVPTIFLHAKEGNTRVSSDRRQRKLRRERKEASKSIFFQIKSVSSNPARMDQISN